MASVGLASLNKLNKLNEFEESDENNNKEDDTAKRFSLTRQPGHITREGDKLVTGFIERHSRGALGCFYLVLFWPTNHDQANLDSSSCLVRALTFKLGTISL